MKLKFNNLGGLFRRRHKLPFLRGVLASLNEQGVSPDVLVLTLRLDSSVELDCANPEAQEKTSAAVVATANFFHLPVLIDTTPQWIGR